MPLADGLALLLLARDSSRGIRSRRAALALEALRERQLSIAEAQLTLAALDALRSAGPESAAEALASICRRHGLDREARVLEAWPARR